MSTIERMTPYGRLYLIKLDCGHTIQRTREEVKAQQLFVEKRIGCEECAEEFRASLTSLEKKTRNL